VTIADRATALARRGGRLIIATGVVAALVACGSSSGPALGPQPSAITASASTDSAGPSEIESSSTAANSTAASIAPPAAAPSEVRPAAGTGPVIVIDPGHAPTITSTDPTTGLNDSDYENEPEMRDVFAVALLVKAQLLADGYQVIMTKNSVTDRVSLGQRAAVANKANAALALSIHDQAGSTGGIGFAQGNNIVYYQSVGDYRETPAGAKVTFTDSAEAAASQRCAQLFQAKRAAAQGASVRLQGNVGYDLASRGLPAGNIWIVQLLSKVPWIYNEAGGNSAGMAGLDAADEQKYAAGLVAGVQACVPV
jgi:N-acetylmuramoyl-L-alanine amidase